MGSARRGARLAALEHVTLNRKRWLVTSRDGRGRCAVAGRSLEPVAHLAATPGYFHEEEAGERKRIRAGAIYSNESLEPVRF